MPGRYLGNSRYHIFRPSAADFSHNATSGKQGGAGGEYYHLTQAIHDGLYSASPLIGLGSASGTRVSVDYGGHIINVNANNGENYLVVNNDGITMLSNSGAQGADFSPFNINKALEELIIGNKLAGTYMQYQYGTDPVFWIKSGTDQLMLMSPQTQRIGITASGGVFFMADQVNGGGGLLRVGVNGSGNTNVLEAQTSPQWVKVGDQARGWIQLDTGLDFKISSNSHMNLTSTILRLGLSAGPNIEVNNSSDQILGYVNSTQLLSLTTPDDGYGGNDHETYLGDVANNAYVWTKWEAYYNKQATRMYAGATNSIQITSTPQFIVQIDGQIQVSGGSNNISIGKQGAGVTLLVDWNTGFVKADVGGVAAFRIEDDVQYIGQDTRIQTDRSTGLITMNVGTSGGGSEKFRLTSSGMQLGAAGATVDTIETALTDDDTHIPTSGAVVDAIAAIPTGTKIEQLNSYVEVVDAGTGTISVVADGFTLATFTSQYGVRIGGTDGNFGRLVHDSGALFMTNQFTNGDIVLNGFKTGPTVSQMARFRPDGGVDLGYNGTVEAETVSGALKATNALQIGSSGLMTIETTITDDDTKLPSSGAVVDYVAAEVPVNITTGTGSPETVVTGNPGDLYFDTTGGVSLTLYVKETGTGNTGWAAK